MTARLTVPDAAVVARRHPVTIRIALEDKTLHGVQRVKRGRWLIEPECLDDWVNGQRCTHQLAAEAAVDGVTDIATRRPTRASA